ncbi:MAG: IS110 family transposase [Thermodesulfobacteriota bacterium]
MERVYYIGLDIHKRIIFYCIKTIDGGLWAQGKVEADRRSLGEWVKGLPGPWVGAMEATIFTGWVYDFPKPHAMDLKVAHPEMLKAITASKKKNERADAERIVDLLRVNLLPECYMLPEEIRELRRILRYRNHIVRTAVKMQNKMTGLLMEVGVPYSKKRIHGKKYFRELLERVEEIPLSVKELLKLSRSNYEIFRSYQKRLVEGLCTNDLIRDRVQGLMAIPGVGELTALTWVLEIGDPGRFDSIRQAVSYCGLCSAQRESAGKEQRGPISKKRNKQLQTMLIEAAKLAPHWNRQLAVLHERELQKGNRNRATLAVARKLVAYMLAVDKQQTSIRPIGEKQAA